jgi:pimeloyl-ACP methyl ester carboxylesterase
MKNTFLLSIITLYSICLSAQFVDTDISLVTTTGKIEGSLVYPEIKQKIPVVLIIAGSGPTDRNGNNPMMKNNSLKMLAEALAANGIASLRFDKRGVAKSASAAVDESDLRFETMINDVEGWIDLLSKDNRFSEITVLGHSEGSTIGMLASQRSEVKKYISLAGPGVMASNKIKEQLAVQAPFIMEQAGPILDSLAAGHIVKEVPPMLLSIARPSLQPYIISWFKYDPQVEIAKLDKPILVIQGTTDIQVSIDDADKLKKANSKAQLEIIENMNHVLKEIGEDKAVNMQSYNNPELPLKNGLVDIVVEFVNNK